MKTENPYYVPAWMAALIRKMLKTRLVRQLRHVGSTERGTYTFKPPCVHCGDTEALTKSLIVWEAGPERVREFLFSFFPTDIGELVHWAEEYARERASRRETYVCRSIIQLLLARAAELFSREYPDRTLVITGDFSLVGRFANDARLRIIGKVEKVEGSTGLLLQVTNKDCPQLEKPSRAWRLQGTWTIAKINPVPKYGPSSEDYEPTVIFEIS